MKHLIDALPPALIYTSLEVWFLLAVRRIWKGAGDADAA